MSHRSTLRLVLEFTKTQLSVHSCTMETGLTIVAGVMVILFCSNHCILIHLFVLFNVCHATISELLIIIYSYHTYILKWICRHSQQNQVTLQVCISLVFTLNQTGIKPVTISPRDSTHSFWLLYYEKCCKYLLDCLLGDNC